MKKRVFIGALVALMLFAFVACEPATIEYPTENGKEIANITVTSATVYAGQDYDGSGSGTAIPAVVSVVYRDGSSTDNVAAELTVTGTPVAGQNFGTVSYSGLTTSGNQPGSWKVAYEAIAVTAAELNVEESDLNVEYSALASACSITGDVVLTYANGTVVTMNDSELSWNSTKQEEITAVTFTVPAAITGTEDIVLSADLTITEKPTAPVVTTWTQKADSATHYFGETVEFAVEGKNASDVLETVTQADFTSKFKVTSITTTNADSETVTLNSIPTTYSLYAVTVKAYSLDNPFLSVTVTIPAGTDYVSNVNASSIYVPTAIVAEATISETSFTVYAAYASGVTKEYTRGSSDYNWSIIEAPAKAPASGSSFDVTFAFKYGKGGTDVGTVTKSVTVGTAQPVPAE